MAKYLNQRWIMLAAVFVFFGAVGTLLEAQVLSEKSILRVAPGKKVSFEYTLTVDDKVMDSNVGKAPLVFTTGREEIVPGLEKAMMGMKIGEKKKVTVKPEEAYGLVDKNGIVEVGKAEIPASSQRVGAKLQTEDTKGNKVQATVKEVREKSVIMDFNHPLAGKTLNFDVKVTDIQ